MREPAMGKHVAVSEVIIVVVLIFTCSSAYGQDRISDPDKWDIHLMPYLWMAELKGDATLRGRTGSVEASFSDILDQLDIGFMGRVEAWKGKWGLIFDGLYMDLGDEFRTPRGRVSTEGDIKLQMYDFGVGHRLLETPVGKDGNQKLSFDLLGGARYVRLEGEIDIKINGPLADIISGRKYGRAEEWFEPFVGGRLRWDLNDKLAAGVRTDFGGFDIGEGSNLTWNLVAGIDYRVKKNLNLKAGYRILDMDFDHGSGSDRIGLDAQFRGPIFGLQYRF